MQGKTKITFIFLFSFFICLVSSVKAQDILGGEYMLVQYILEQNGHRSVMHFQLVVDGDTSGTYKELFREQGVPDSGSFNYYIDQDRTFIIPEEDGSINHGIGDDQGDVFTLVRSDSNFALFAIGVRKSSGRTVADLSGEYWAMEFMTDSYFQATGLNLVEFDGEGNATMYRLQNTVGELDTIDLTYTVEDDGSVLLDNFLIGVLSPDGQFLVAGMFDWEWGENFYVIAIKKSAGILDNSALTGSYIFNQVRTEIGGLNEESAFYAGVDFDGIGEAEVIMYLGEPFTDTFPYVIQEDGSLDMDSSPGAVSVDGRYFFNLETGDTTSVAFGLGIQAENFTMSALNQNLSASTPSSFLLEKNYPNPFNPTTTINYQLPVTSYVNMNIYNLLGQEVAVLVSEKQPAGRYQVEWDASEFASGVYYYRLYTSSGYIQTKKLILLR